MERLEKFLLIGKVIQRDDTGPPTFFHQVAFNDCAPITPCPIETIGKFRQQVLHREKVLIRRRLYTLMRERGHWLLGSRYQQSSGESTFFTTSGQLYVAHSNPSDIVNLTRLPSLGRQLRHYALTSSGLRHPPTWRPTPSRHQRLFAENVVL